jgi:hypothetical protein
VVQHLWSVLRGSGRRLSQTGTSQERSKRPEGGPGVDDPLSSQTPLPPSPRHLSLALQLLQELGHVLRVTSCPPSALPERRCLSICTVNNTRELPRTQILNATKNINVGRLSRAHTHTHTQRERERDPCPKGWQTRGRQWQDGRASASPSTASSPSSSDSEPPQGTVRKCTMSPRCRTGHLNQCLSVLLNCMQPTAKMSCRPLNADLKKGGGQCLLRSRS